MTSFVGQDTSAIFWFHVDNFSEEDRESPPSSMKRNLKLERCPITSFAGTLTILLLLSSAHAYAATIHQNPAKAPCRIEIGNAHVSTHFKEVMGFKAVKVNAESICNVTQSKVRLTVQIYKVGFLRDYLISERSTNPLSPTFYGVRVKNQEFIGNAHQIEKPPFMALHFQKQLSQDRNLLPRQLDHRKLFLSYVEPEIISVYEQRRREFPDS